MTSIELLRGLELCANWADDDLLAVARLGAERRFDAGSLLLRQGDPAIQAFAIAQGEVAVLRTLPGGGELMLAQKGAGVLVGELGLLAAQPRSASVRALSPVHSVMFERSVFTAACRMRQPAARRLLLAVMGFVCGRLRELLLHLTKNFPAAEAPCALAVGVTHGDFNYRQFLHLLRCATALGDVGLTAFADRASPHTLSKGETLLVPGSTAPGLWLVVRGALETVAGAEPHAATLEVLGPGSLAGLPSVMDGLPLVAGVRAREHSLVLHLAQAEFERACESLDDFAFGLLHAVAEQLAGSLPRLSNRLAQHTGLRRSQAILARSAAAGVIA